MGYKCTKALKGTGGGGLASGANSATTGRERGKFVMVHFHFMKHSYTAHRMTK